MLTHCVGLPGLRGAIAFALALQASEGYRIRADTGSGTPQHGLPSKPMALITSDDVIMRSLSIKWP